MVSVRLLLLSLRCSCRGPPSLELLYERPTYRNMFQKTWRFVDIYGHLCHLFPEDGACSFQQLTIFGLCRCGLSFDPLERWTPLAVDRVDALDILALHAHEIAFVEPLEFFIHLVTHAPFALLRQAVILLAGLPGTKANPVDIPLGNGNLLPSGKCRDTERIDDVRFGQTQGLAIGGGLIAKDRGRRDRMSKSGIQVGFSLHRTLGDLVQMSTHPFHLEGDFPLVDLI